MIRVVQMVFAEVLKRSMIKTDVIELI